MKYKNVSGFIITFCLILVSSLLSENSEIKNTKLSPNYKTLFEYFSNLQDNIQYMADIDSITFKRDVAEFKLSKGKIYFFRPYLDQEITALYVGEGLFKFSPPNKIEQDQLFRFYEQRSLESKFKLLFLVFNDSTVMELKKNLTLNKADELKAIKPKINNCLDYFVDKGNEFIDTEIAKCFLDRSKRDFFYAHFSELEEHKPLFFEIDPYDDEEVKFMHRAELMHYDKVPEIICQFKKQNDTNTNEHLIEKDDIRIESFIIETHIDDDLDFSAHAQMKLKALKENMEWINFYIFKDMIIDSVISPSGRKITLYKPEEHGSVWLQMEKIPSKDETLHLDFYYHTSKIFDSDEDQWIYFNAPYSWYPNYFSDGAANYECIFHFPVKYTLVCGGEKVSSELVDEVKIEKWKSINPGYIFSFNFGNYEEEIKKESGLPDIHILRAKHGHSKMSDKLSKEIYDDVSNSIKLYKYLFGDISFSHLYVSETPYNHGLAFPGLIHLSWTTFENSLGGGYEEIFRSHEVAHQWWGIGAGTKTYHDKWLSEALAEYSGLWYMQVLFKDNEKFFKVLDKWKETILDNRKYLLGDGQEAGPIYLGYRTSSSQTEGDYDLIIYKKGAWIFHMLRNMMLDLSSLSENKFTDMLKDYFTRFNGKKATTENFKAVVEKHVNMKMDWFFNQWIYSTEIPSYKYGYKTEPTTDGKFLLTVKVNQENVQNDFQMPVIIKLDFGEEKFARISRIIKGKTCEFQLKVLAEPVKIVFNEFESVLAEIEEVDFDDL